jgi:chromate transporter
MQHEVVVARGWMDARTFMDGIALGQVTPGPIVITATFVGYLLRGLAGAVIGTVAIFSPSFLLLSLTLPAFDRLQGAPAFRKAMRGALLAFVGLLAATTIRFGIAVDWTVPAGLLGIAAFIALRYKVDIIWVVVGGGILSLLLL